MRNQTGKVATPQPGVAPQGRRIGRPRRRRSRVAAPLTATVSSGVLPRPLTAGEMPAAHTLCRPKQTRESAEPSGRLWWLVARYPRVQQEKRWQNASSNPGPRPTVCGSACTAQRGGRRRRPATHLFYSPSGVLLPGRGVLVQLQVPRVPLPQRLQCRRRQLRRRGVTDSSRCHAGQPVCAVLHCLHVRQPATCWYCTAPRVLLVLRGLPIAEFVSIERSLSGLETDLAHAPFQRPARRKSIVDAALALRPSSRLNNSPSEQHLTIVQGRGIPVQRTGSSPQLSAWRQSAAADPCCPTGATHLAPAPR